MDKRLRAGVAVAEISPGTGIELAGYPHHPRHNTGVHDPLYAGCICLDNGSVKLAIVTMDLLFYSKKYAAGLRKMAEASTGIPAGNIMICCSHTHSGPWASGRLDQEALEKGLKPDDGYIEMLQDKLHKLIMEANGSMFDAGIGLGVGTCGREQGVGGNRRRPDGPADPSVNVLGVCDENGAWRGCLVGYALHPTVIHSDSTVVTADYPGYIRRYLKHAMPGTAVLFAQGTSGDQSTRYFRDGQTFEEACRIGTTIGVEAGRVLKGIKADTHPELLVKSAVVELETRTYPDRKTAEENVKAAVSKVEALKKSNAPYVDVWNAELKLYGAEDILGYIIMRDNGVKPDLLADELPAEVQAIGIGDARIVGLQGEVFVQIGLDIKKKSPYGTTFVFELANGVAPGYIYTKEALDEGGYETDTSMLGENCADILVDNAVKLLKSNI